MELHLQFSNSNYHSYEFSILDSLPFSAHCNLYQKMCFWISVRLSRCITNTFYLKAVKYMSDPLAVVWLAFLLNLGENMRMVHNSWAILISVSVSSQYAYQSKSFSFRFGKTLAKKGHGRVLRLSNSVEAAGPRGGMVISLHVTPMSFIDQQYWMKPEHPRNRVSQRPLHTYCIEMSGDRLRKFLHDPDIH